jgi:hypothetical protein
MGLTSLVGWGGLWFLPMTPNFAGGSVPDFLARRIELAMHWPRSTSASRKTPGRSRLMPKSLR